MNDGIKVLAAAVAKSLLPYPDPIRHRRIRRQARSLASWTKWPGESATASEVAELALIRLLWLQREVHRAARSGQKEATALLARAAIETCLTGLWCLYEVEPVERLRNQEAKSLHRIMEHLVGSIITDDFLDKAVASVGKPVAPLDLASMVKRITDAGGPDTVTHLYKNFYVPASILYAHGGGAAMLRHVGNGGAPTDEPSSGWLRRSAVHVADGCVGVLAHVIASQSNRPADHFVPYAHEHLIRALPPFASMGGGDSLRSLQPKSLPRAVRAYRELQRYFKSETYQSDDSEASQTVIRAGVDDMMSLFKRDGSEEAKPLVIDELVRQLSEYDPTAADPK